jgi:hypothetical protein
MREFHPELDQLVAFSVADTLLAKRRGHVGTFRRYWRAHRNTGCPERRRPALFSPHLFGCDHRTRSSASVAWNHTRNSLCCINEVRPTVAGPDHAREGLVERVGGRGQQVRVAPQHETEDGEGEGSAGKIEKKAK